MIDFSQVTNITLGSTPVEQVTDSQDNVLWSAAPVVLPNYFYVEDVSGAANTLSIVKDNTNAPTIEVFASTDTVNWALIGTTSTTAITTTIPANSKLHLKANTNGWSTSASNCNRINCTGNFNVGGNIMSLLYNDNFSGKTTLPTATTQFQKLFNNDMKLINAGNLILPATTVAEGCYGYMFQGCTSLTTTPQLPATTLANSCYIQMFGGCASLTTAPQLPATTLANSCYQQLFDGCTSLTTAPELPATTLATACYQTMFRSCSSLTTAPALPFTGQLPTNAYKNMFRGCTSLTESPIINSTNLSNYGVCAEMFYDCTNISKITIYASNITGTNCLQNWVNGVAATGDFYNLGSATYPSGASGIPSGWTEHTSL